MQTPWTHAIQIIEAAKDRSEAETILSALRLLVDHIASRILKPSPAKPGFRVQAITEGNGEFPSGWLPDGCKHVMWRGYF